MEEKIKINIAQPQMGDEEKQAVLEVLDSGILAQGPRVATFEEAFAEMCGVHHAIATSSGTTALHTALLAYGISAGDEVITSSFTFIASANSILYTGARPVFVDIDPSTFNIDPLFIEEAITENTRAIMPVHLFGLSCDMNPIIELATKYNLIVIEDACQSHGATYSGQKVGSFGTGTFSFYPTKNMTSAEGGMITTNDEEFAAECRIIRQHGMRMRYYHEDLGFNFRMTDVHAAIGHEQLKKLATFNENRQQNAAFLSNNLMGVELPKTPEGYEHVFHQYTIRMADGKRDELFEHMKKNEIGCGIYYPVPLHQQSYYVRELGYDQELPETERAAAEVLSLPVHPALSSSDLEQIAGAVNAFAGTERP